MSYLGMKLGEKIRRRRIEKTGKDPAENPVGRGFRLFERKYPILAGVVAVALLAGALALRVIV